MCGWDSLRRGLGLAGEPLADVLLEGELGRKDLDGDAALKPLVAGPVDHAHPAAADLALDGIRVAQRLGEPGRQRLIGRVGHGRWHLWGRARGERNCAARWDGRTWPTICTDTPPAATEPRVGPDGASWSSRRNVDGVSRTGGGHGADSGFAHGSLAFEMTGCLGIDTAAESPCSSRQYGSESLGFPAGPAAPALARKRPVP